jgi:AcrR family transcriptional regulator
MLLGAVVKLAANEGYEGLTVPRIRGSAGISRRRFEEHFASVDECFLSALDLQAKRVLGTHWIAGSEIGGWPSRVHRTLASLCHELAKDPVLGNLIFLEAPKAGSDATRWRAGSIARLGSFLRASAPPESRSSALAAEASLAAVWSLLEASVNRGRGEGLAQLAGPAAYLILAPAIGPGAAAETIRAQSDRGRTRVPRRYADLEPAQPPTGRSTSRPASR